MVVVVAARLLGSDVGGGRSAKLAAPQDQCGIQQAAIVKILNQGGQSLICLGEQVSLDHDMAPLSAGPGGNEYLGKFRKIEVR